jgi:hypothetical protein
MYLSFTFGMQLELATVILSVTISGFVSNLIATVGALMFVPK